MGQWLDSLTGWLSANPQWLGLAIFLVACIECLAIAGIIVPGTVLLFAVAVLAGSGVQPGRNAAAGLSAACWATPCLTQWASTSTRTSAACRCATIRNGSAAPSYFQRYGIASLLVGRFIGPLRPMLPMVAGMFDMPLPRFIAVSLLAGAGWSVAYLLPGWATGAAMRLPLPEGFWLTPGSSPAPRGADRPEPEHQPA
jgi:undecaprenyl-diphosphatase